jgi:hypothetical protein
MQYTLRNVPPALDDALRAMAARERKSLNEAAIEALARGLGFDGPVRGARDLSDIAGQWVDDPEVERALDEQRRVDEALWR